MNSTHEVCRYCFRSLSPNNLCTTEVIYLGKKEIHKCCDFTCAHALCRFAMSNERLPHSEEIRAARSAALRGLQLV